MTEGKPPFRLTRARRRVLLVLLSGAGNLSGFPIMRAAQAGSGTVYPVLACLERLGWVQGDWAPRVAPPEVPAMRRRFYRLTPAGRAAVLRLLGLTDGSERIGT